MNNIFGVGTDIIEISRVDKFTNTKIFTTFEIENNNPRSLAGIFCAKEAIVKSFGTGFRTFFPCDIEIRKDNLGKPFPVFYNKASEYVESNNFFVEISISHSQEYATAFAIAVKKIDEQ